jgi:hypothetical protein
MLTRLHSSYPDLADAVLQASPEKRKRIVEGACMLAVNGLDLERVLREGIVASIRGTRELPGDTRALLERLQVEADDHYLRMLDSLKSEEALPVEGQASFRRARALAAILAGTGEVDAVTATDVLYEVLASGADHGALRTIVSDH